MTTMSLTHPSIQSFYRSEVRVQNTEAPEVVSAKPGDGFTEEELADALDPLNRKWNPEREYEELNIIHLIPGPRAVTFCGRLVNLNTIHGRNQKQPKASGWHFLIVKDDSAAISIKLFFARNPYPLKLGQLITSWTAFISDTSKSDSAAIDNVTICANLFPGRVTSDHVMIHTSGSTDSICRTPLEYQKGSQLPGLVTLNSYLTSGHDGVRGVKILVCVKSIGQKKRISKKGGGECDLIDILLFDHTAELRMTLWNDIIESTKNWQAGNTILLITNPGYRVGYSGKGSVGVQHGTMIEVEPEFPDAHWLRKQAVAMTKRESSCLEFPEGVWDVEDAEYGVQRMLFTLASLDQWVRNDGHQIFSGFISVVIMEMSLVSLHRRNMLMCAECCGVPIYSNAIITPCRNCSKPLALFLNPRVIGTLLDETGSIAGGRLLWSPRAWEQLFGRSIQEMAEMSSEEIMWLEQRLLFLRMHLVIGWAPEEMSGGRLAVLGMMA